MLIFYIPAPLAQSGKKYIFFYKCCYSLLSQLVLSLQDSLARLKHFLFIETIQMPTMMEKK